MYKITIKQIEIKEVKETNYVVVGKEADGENTYGYADETKEKEIEQIILEQRLEELDISKLAIFLNTK